MVIGYTHKNKTYKVEYEEESYREQYSESEMDILVVPQSMEASVRLVPRTNNYLDPKEKESLWCIHDLNEKHYVKIRAFEDTVKLNVGNFFLFCSESQRFWERKKRGDASPWSAHPAIARVGNVYRELQADSQYLRAHLLDLHKTQSDWAQDEWATEVLFVSYIYRLVQRPRGFEEIGFPSLSDLTGYLEKVKGNSMFLKYSSLDTSGFELAFHQTATNIIDTTGRLLEAQTVQDAFAVLDGLPSSQQVRGAIFRDLMQSNCLNVKGEMNYCELGPDALRTLVCCFSPLG